MLILIYIILTLFLIYNIFYGYKFLNYWKTEDKEIHKAFKSMMTIFVVLFLVCSSITVILIFG